MSRTIEPPAVPLRLGSTSWTADRSSLARPGRGAWPPRRRSTRREPAPPGSSPTGAGARRARPRPARLAAPGTSQPCHRPRASGASTSLDLLWPGWPCRSQRPVQLATRAPPGQSRPAGKRRGRRQSTPRAGDRHGWRSVTKETGSLRSMRPRSGRGRAWPHSTATRNHRRAHDRWRSVRRDPPDRAPREGRA